MRWFYLEACLDGKGSRGLMSLVLMQKKHLTIVIKWWFYVEACLVGKRSGGLMNLVLMFFKEGGFGEVC